MSPPDARRPRSAPHSAAVYDPTTHEYTLTVRSEGTIDRRKTTRLVMSAPQPEEECCISMEPIAEYTMGLEQRANETPVQSMVPQAPLLTKATLPCGHGFSALALLYHFTKNDMTCPCCRSGHAKMQMARQSIPQHMRPALERRMAASREEERMEQIASDTLTVAAMLELEVNSAAPPPAGPADPFMRVTRRVLILYAYEAMDSLAPSMAQEIPLVTHHRPGTRLELCSSGFSMRELNRNLRNLPVHVRAYELVVASRSMYYGVSTLIRSHRFEIGPASPAVVPCLGGFPDAVLEVSMTPDTMGFGSVSLSMPTPLLTILMLANA